MMKICFATHNKNKLKEVRQMVNKHEIGIVGLDDLGFFEEIPETGSSFEQNALLKVKTIYDHFKMPCFADDSGLEVKALHGAPGVYSARYAGKAATSDQNIDLLLQRMDGENFREARFKTVIAFINEYSEVCYFEGKIEGVIAEQRQGTKGFGYDPIFIPHGKDQSFAQMSASAKNRISHRAIAMKYFLEYLINLDFKKHE